MKFHAGTHARYWWHHLPGKNYDPIIYSALDRDELALVAAWYEETENRRLIGEVAVPFMSVLQGFIMASGLCNIVQCGHYAGYSTLLIGFYLRRMGKKNAFVSIDIDERMTRFTKEWVDRAGLGEFVRVHCGDSTARSAVAITEEHFGAKAKAVVIDSSHEYAQTTKELDLWYDALQRGGLIFLHDISEFAARFDGTGSGGVCRALEEWLAANDVECIRINSRPPNDLASAAYADVCGLGIIHKRYQSHGV